MGSSDTKSKEDLWGISSELYAKIAIDLTHPAAKTIVDLADSLHPFSAPSTYDVDDGTGAGAITSELSRRHPDVKILATDLSPGMLEQVANLGLKNVTTKEANGEDLSEIRKGNPDGFSHVLSSFMNQFATDPVKVLSEMISCARPGGLIILGSWGYLQNEDAFIHATNKVDPNWKSPGAWTSEDRWPEDAQSLTKIFEGQGLKDVKVHAAETSFESLTEEEFLHFYFEGGNPALEKYQGDFRRKHTKEEWDEIRRIYPVWWRKKGGTHRDMKLPYFIGVGRKAG